MNEIRTGFIRGTGAAVNVPLGFVPDAVIVWNHTDGDIFTMAAPSKGVMPFSGGGTNEIEKGDTIVGATSGARAKVLDVILDSGSWAGGNAAGWLIVDQETKTGTFTSENVYATDTASGTDDATVTVDLNPNINSDTEIASATGNAAITPYFGSDTVEKGFTIGSTVSEDAKLLYFVALRSGAGGSGRAAANSL